MRDIFPVFGLKTRFCVASIGFVWPTTQQSAVARRRLATMGNSGKFREITAGSTAQVRLAKTGKDRKFPETAWAGRLAGFIRLSKSLRKTSFPPLPARCADFRAGAQ